MQNAIWSQLVGAVADAVTNFSFRAFIVWFNDSHMRAYYPPSHRYVAIIVITYLKRLAHFSQAHKKSQLYFVNMDYLSLN